jgi:hypothetical protein
VEDQGGLPTSDTIRHVIGERVAIAVESCSDSTASDPAKKLPWQERKEKCLAHLRSANHNALIVAAADKLHNVRAVLSDYRELGESLWERFNPSGQDQLWFYCNSVEVLSATRAPKVLVDELERVTDHLEQLTSAMTRNPAATKSHTVPGAAELPSGRFCSGRMVKIFKCAERARSSVMDVEDEHNHMRAAFGLRFRFGKPGTPAAE